MSGKFVIAKEFTFEMGHRVWAQKLSHPDLSISTDCACKHLHGHSYRLKISLTADRLDESGMVTDFKNLNYVKAFVDDVLDHKFMIDISDPLFGRITGVDAGTISNTKFPNFTNLSTLTTDISESPEFIESFIVVRFIPTSENICMFLKRELSVKLDMALANVTLDEVELWETSKSSCRYQ